MTTSINFPKETIGAYDVITYPSTFGMGSQVYAIIFKAGSRQAFWETLSFDTPGQALDEARKWIDRPVNVFLTKGYNAI